MSEMLPELNETEQKIYTILLQFDTDCYFDKNPNIREYVAKIMEAINNAH